MVVVVHELSQHPSEMALVEHHDVIKTFCADGLNEPFRDRVGLRRPRRRPDAGDTEAAGPHIEVAAVDAVPVLDEVGRFATPRCRLKQLLPDPGRRRTGRDVELDQLTALVADKDVQDPVLNGVDDQQIGCPDGPELIREKGPPSLGSAARRLAPPISADRAIADDDPQLEQFAANALGTPEPVLLGNPGDQIPHLAAESRAAEAGP